MNRAAPLAAVAAAVATGALAAAGAAEPARGDLRVEGGSGYDSNVHRLEQEPCASDDPPPCEEVAIAGSPLIRLGARGRLSWRPRPDERLRLLGHSHAKLFTHGTGRDENVLVVAGEAGWERGLGAGGATVGAAGSYYDAFEVNLAGAERQYEARTFRTGTAEAQVGVGGWDRGRVVAGLGYRLFRYKPKPLFDWDGPSLGLGWHATLWRGDPDADDDAASLDSTAAYRVERRGYADSARTNACPDGSPPDLRCTAPTDIDRHDLHHGVALEAQWTGARVYSARYELEVNDSNSYGESLVRQRLELATTVELTPAWFVTGEAAVLYNVFIDALLVPPSDVLSQTFVTIEDENRNSLSALLAWKLAAATTVEARWAIYSNEFATDELEFRRQTFYLGVVRELR